MTCLVRFLNVNRRREVSSCRGITLLSWIRIGRILESGLLSLTLEVTVSRILVASELVPLVATV